VMKGMAHSLQDSNLRQMEELDRRMERLEDAKDSCAHSDCDDAATCTIMGTHSCDEHRKVIWLAVKGAP